MKRRDDYTAPVPCRVLETLREYRARLRKRLVELGKDPQERLSPKATIFGLSEETSVAATFRLACRAAGLELTFHDCRRNFNPIDLVMAARQTGFLDAIRELRKIVESPSTSVMPTWHGEEE